MKSRIFSAGVALALAGAACGGKTASPEKERPAQAKDSATSQIAVCAEANDGVCSKTISTFSAGAPFIYASYVTNDVPRAGTRFHFDWIADDVGRAAPPNTRIQELDLASDSASLLGGLASSYTVKANLSRPTKGWPVGKYHVELHREGKLISTVSFRIAAP